MKSVYCHISLARASSVYLGFLKIIIIIIISISISSSSINNNLLY